MEVDRRQAMSEEHSRTGILVGCFSDISAEWRVTLTLLSRSFAPRITPVNIEKFRVSSNTRVFSNVLARSQLARV